MGEPLTVFAIGDIDELGIRGVVLRGSDPETIRDAGKSLHQPVVVVPVEQWKQVVEALTSARAVIQEDRDEMFDAVTVAGIESTMDEIDRPHVERLDAILARIDAALSRHGEGK